MRFNARGAKDAKDANDLNVFTLAPFAPVATFAFVFMKRLTGELAEQFAEGARLEAEIRRNLGRLGYEF